MTDTTDIPIDIGNSAARRTPLPAGLVGRLWSRALGRALWLPLDDTRVATRGFQVDSPQVVERLEGIGAHFAHGYNSAIRSASLDQLMAALASAPPDDAGFAFEGAAMGLALTDWMTPGRRWFDAFVAGPANPHEYMAWVGLGWSLARLPVSPVRALRRHRSINKWLALDGWGFHQGYFAWRRSVAEQRRPRSLGPAPARVFDQGLGRSLWFIFGARPLVIADAIVAFEPGRHGDLWSGVGLAATYAGGVDARGLGTLLAAAAEHAAALGQGVVFAAAARHRAGNPVAHSGLACQGILGLSLSDAADLARRCLPQVGDDIESYQRWRGSVQAWCGHRLGRRFGHHRQSDADADATASAPGE